jgi:hypothetical protein
MIDEAGDSDNNDVGGSEDIGMSVKRLLVSVNSLPIS